MRPVCLIIARASLNSQSAPETATKSINPDDCDEHDCVDSHVEFVPQQSQRVEVLICVESGDLLAQNIRRLARRNAHHQRRQTHPDQRAVDVAPEYAEVKPAQVHHLQIVHQYRSST